MWKWHGSTNGFLGGPRKSWFSVAAYATRKQVVRCRPCAPTASLARGDLSGGKGGDALHPEIDEESYTAVVTGGVSRWCRMVAINALRRESMHSLHHHLCCDSQGPSLGRLASMGLVRRLQAIICLHTVMVLVEATKA